MCVLKIKFLPSAVQKLSSETDTDGQMDRETDTYTHTDKQTDRQTWLNLLPTKYTNGNYYVNWSIVLNFDLVLIKDTVNLKEVFRINRGWPVWYKNQLQHQPYIVTQQHTIQIQQNSYQFHTIVDCHTQNSIIQKTLCVSLSANQGNLIPLKIVWKTFPGYSEKERQRNMNICTTIRVCG